MGLVHHLNPAVVFLYIKNIFPLFVGQTHKLTGKLPHLPVYSWTLMKVVMAISGPRSHVGVAVVPVPLGGQQPRWLYGNTCLI